MSPLKIISRLWSAIYDLLLLAKGTPAKTLEEIEEELDLLEYQCRPYADMYDIEQLENAERRDYMKTRRIRDEPGFSGSKTETGG